MAARFAVESSLDGIYGESCAALCAGRSRSRRWGLALPVPRPRWLPPSPRSCRPCRRRSVWQARPSAWLRAGMHESVCMCVCEHACACEHLHMCVCVYCACVSTCVRVSARVCVGREHVCVHYKHMCVYKHVCMRVECVCAEPGSEVYVCACECMCMGVRVCMCEHTRAWKLVFSVSVCVCVRARACM